MAFSESPHLVSTAVVAAVVALCACAPMSGSVPGKLSERHLSALQLRQLEGEAIDLRATTRDHEATVLVWWATRCPCVKRYQQRVEALRDAFPAGRVAFLAVASNADDDATTVAEEAQARKMRIPIAIDPGGRLASALGVRTTPTIVVLDGQARVVFHGWIDNERQPGEPGREAYARQAIVATLAGRRPFKRQTPVYGCMITRKLGEQQRCLPAPQPETCHAGHE